MRDFMTALGAVLLLLGVIGGAFQALFALGEPDPSQFFGLVRAFMTFMGGLAGGGFFLALGHIISRLDTIAARLPDPQADTQVTGGRTTDSRVS